MTTVSRGTKSYSSSSLYSISSVYEMDFVRTWLWSILISISEAGVADYDIKLSRDLYLR